MPFKFSYIHALSSDVLRLLLVTRVEGHKGCDALRAGPEYAMMCIFPVNFVYVLMLFIIYEYGQVAMTIIQTV